MPSALPQSAGQLLHQAAFKSGRCWMDEEADSWKVESGSLAKELCKSDCNRGPCVICGCRFGGLLPRHLNLTDDARQRTRGLEVDERTVLRGKQRERTLLTKKRKGRVFFPHLESKNIPSIVHLCAATFSCPKVFLNTEELDVSGRASF